MRRVLIALAALSALAAAGVLAWLPFRGHSTAATPKPKHSVRIVVKQPQTTIQSLSSEIIDFKRTDVVELRDPAKNRIRFYVDRETKLPVKMQVRRSDETNLNEEQYGNWHKFQGVMTPLFVGRYKDGVKIMEIRAETAAYNSGLSDNLFSPPATK